MNVFHGTRMLILEKVAITFFYISSEEFGFVKIFDFRFLKDLKVLGLGWKM